MPDGPTKRHGPMAGVMTRVILRDGVRLGRVYREVFGPLKGQWQFFGMWAGHDNRGQTETLAEALETTRSRAPGDAWICDKR